MRLRWRRSAGAPARAAEGAQTTELALCLVATILCGSVAAFRVVAAVLGGSGSAFRLVAAVLCGSVASFRLVTAVLGGRAASFRLLAAVLSGRVASFGYVDALLGGKAASFGYVTAVLGGKAASFGYVTAVLCGKAASFWLVDAVLSGRVASFCRVDALPSGRIASFRLVAASLCRRAASFGLVAAVLRGTATSLRRVAVTLCWTSTSARLVAAASPFRAAVTLPEDALTARGASRTSEVAAPSMPTGSHSSSMARDMLLEKDHIGTSSPLPPRWGLHASSTGRPRRRTFAGGAPHSLPRHRLPALWAEFGRGTARARRARLEDDAMKNYCLFLAALCIAGCEQKSASPSEPTSPKSTEVTSAPIEAPHPPVDPTNIVSIAGGSKDHTTLVAALKAADYVDSISNPGPFTVFAPTNAAFDKLPKGTVESLVTPAKQSDLRTILQHHVTVSTYAPKDLHDGQVLSMVDGGKLIVHVTKGKLSIGDANVIASIPASNGYVHIVDTVLLPAAK